MCYVHVAALVAEFLHRKSKCVLFGGTRKTMQCWVLGGSESF